ncbi:TlpA family protein disulfide reductase [Reichenbachiella carrageenanivorans]|uniref:TlpA family protein disulfide reductase n=1 Tax=Reichenbachiella carrageenanivorans TaxID=2979869 RepID=A0ABY6D3Y0_9BACT|nr:TlpA disulfide reductase family protein [Reichenbachiella carrageenanivorans]UXX79768.1 TlpA family protein disulfide reductase [Reichenbachiella carrageenanivorans]
MKHLTRRLLFFLLFTFVFLDFSNAQSVEVIKYPDLAKLISTPSEKNKVINFWATWCRPCIKELPQFLDLYEKYNSENLELSLISFDFVEDLDSKLIPFLTKRNIKANVYLLDETDYNSFIDKVDPAWSGAIPATLMMTSKNTKRIFIEKEFTENELEKVYLNFIK